MKIKIAAGGWLLSLAAASAHAHGDMHHAHKKFDAASAEQKAFGIAGDPKKANKTIEVAMTDDMRFSPANIRLQQGETVRFIVANGGQIMHEMVLGTAQQISAHAQLMKKFPDMEHDEPNMAHVRPGTSEQMVWRFNRPGQFEFACLMPGHYEAGMKGRITVTKREKR